MPNALHAKKHLAFNSPKAQALSPFNSPTIMAKQQRQHCSFCGRPDTEVGMLIAGVSGYICNECAEQAYEIARETKQHSKKRDKAGDGEQKELRKP